MNFNTITNGFVYTYALIIVNNWNGRFLFYFNLEFNKTIKLLALVSGYVVVTSRWARLFFVANNVMGFLVFMK
jgi:hypothetical protein